MIPPDTEKILIDRFGEPEQNTSSIDLVLWIHDVLEEESELREKADHARKPHPSDLSMSLLPPEIRVSIADHWERELQNMNAFVRPRVIEIGNLLATDTDDPLWKIGMQNPLTKRVISLIHEQALELDPQNTSQIEEFSTSFANRLLGDSEHILITSLATDLKYQAEQLTIRIDPVMRRSGPRLPRPK